MLQLLPLAVVLLGGAAALERCRERAPPAVQPSPSGNLGLCAAAVAEWAAALVILVALLLRRTAEVQSVLLEAATVPQRPSGVLSHAVLDVSTGIVAISPIDAHPSRGLEPCDGAV